MVASKRSGSGCKAWETHIPPDPFFPTIHFSHWQSLKDYSLKLLRMYNQNKFTVINSEVDSGLKFEVLGKDHWLMLKIYKQTPMSVKCRESSKGNARIFDSSKTAYCISSSLSSFFLHISPGNEENLEIVF